jgi:hypothetical protein
MRLLEFTNAAEQLELWKLINDTVFNVLTQQAKQAENERAAAERTSKSQHSAKPSIKKSSLPPPAPLPVKFQPSSIKKALPPKSLAPIKPQPPRSISL